MGEGGMDPCSAVLSPLGSHYMALYSDPKLAAGFVTSHGIATCSLETFSTAFTEPVPYAVPFCVRHFCLVPA